MGKNEKLITAMIEYDAGMPKQIQHFLKVYEFAHLIGKQEGIDEKTQNILETAAILHDIGIRNSLKKYGDSYGKHQEELGPAEAQKILADLGYPEDLISRVMYLIGHHHTYTKISGADYQILVEADFLVNLYEDQESKEVILRVLDTIFKTTAGTEILTVMFGLTNVENSKN